MKYNEIRSLIELVVFVVMGLLPVLGISSIPEGSLPVIYAIIISMIVVYYLIKKLVIHLKQKKLDKQGMSSNTVIRNVRKYCKSLLKYAKASEKKLLQVQKIKELKKARVEEKKVLDLISNNKLTSKNEKIKERIQKLEKNLSDHQTVKIIESLDKPHDYLVSQLISDTFESLERILLNAEQFDLRIRFGHYILYFSDKLKSRISANIDYLGWTYMMMGNVKMGEKSINSGIEMAKREIKKTTNASLVETLNYAICRGYRHLGSARLIYENKPELAIEHLNQALNVYYQIHSDNATNLNKESEMYVGIKYGLLISELYRFLKKRKEGKITDQSYIELYTNYCTLQEYITCSETFQNPHRYVKFQVLNVKYMKTILEEFGRMKNHIRDMTYSIEELKVKIKESLNEVNVKYKRNIFMDEAIEYYLEESVKYFQNELIDKVNKEVLK